MATIDHGNGYKTQYSHLQQLSGTNDDPVCQSGSSQVKAGDLIGYVGMTGCTSGPHIHFELQFDDTSLDPSGWKDNLGVPDPWSRRPDGNSSHHLWQFNVPSRVQWQISGLVGGSYTSGGVTVTAPPGAFTGVVSFTLSHAPVAQPSATLKPTGHSFDLGTSQTLPFSTLSAAGKNSEK
jgi:hypothetical protein